ncbi:MAG: sensor histidine kinase [Burkholderiales bacterium]|jgi:signal transduction histidine kinase|nr:MAG: sensor histidine kinase [Burkholderiales bacterium]
MNKRLYRVLACLAAALLAGLLYVTLVPVPPGPPPERFEAAQFCLQHTHEWRYSRAGFSEVFASTQTPAEACWQTVQLPEHVRPDAHARHELEPALFQAWFRVHYTPPLNLPRGETLQIYVPRVMGAAWQVVINGRQVANNLDDWRMTWNRPLAVRLDPSLIATGQPLDIRVGVIQRAWYGASMTPIVVGPTSGIAPALALRQLLQITMPQASTVVLLLMGSFFVVFWLARPMERIHLLLALASLAWGVCNLQYVLHRPDDALFADWYARIVNMSISWVMWLIYLFVLRIDLSRRLRWLEQALPWYVLGMTMLALPFWPLVDDIGVLYQLLNSLVAAGVTLAIARQAWRPHGLPELRVISLSLVLTMAAGMHDVALLAQLITPESIYLLPYGTLLMFASFLYAVQRRYVAAIQQTEQLSNSLAERLGLRELELREQHSRLLSIEREQALLLERQRLMRDMHDGLGAALMSSLVLVEQGRMQTEDIAIMLRECVDDLRLVIDSLEPVGQDLVTLLATMRYRLGRRLEHAGLKVDWAVRDLPALPWLDPSHALQVLRIVQETLTNILKHAEASRVRIETLLLQKPGLPDQVCVHIEDDGKGFDIDTIAPGRGLRHLRQRAQKLNGDLDIHSQQGQGTRVTLLLPVHLMPGLAS